MAPLEIGLLGILALFALILLHVPIAFAMLAVGVVGYGLQAGWQPALTFLSSEPMALMANVDLITLALFLLMGSFASAAGFSADIYALAAALLGHRRGGLAFATIGGCAAFGAVCGSSTATAATFAKIALPEMLKRRYSPAFAAGTIAAGGALKALIPPSLVMILYCIVAKTFIFDLFKAAIIPAVIVIVLNLATIAIIARLDPSAAPLAARVPARERIAAAKRALPAFVLMLTVFGGFYSGIFTVNEAASVAAVLAFAFALVRGRLDWSIVSRSLQETASVSAMLYMILIGASVFSYFITLTRVPEALVQFVHGLDMPPLAIIAVVLAAYLILGAVFDEIAAMLITLPFVLPVILKLGYDPVWWGIVNVVVIELGLIIPPIGIIVFLLHGMAPQIAVRTIYRGVAPFIAADLLLLALLVVFPQTVLWLPKLLSS